MQTLAVVLVALGCGLAAVLGVRQALKKPAPVAEATVPAVVAKASLRRDQMLDASMVAVRDVPKDQAPAAGFASIEEAVGRTVSIPMLKGEFVVEPKLLPKGSRPGMAGMIKPGMRAFTILTPTFSSSLAGFLQPGNRVDVLLTSSSNGSQSADQSTSFTVLQNLELLAVHTMVDATTAEKPANPTDSRSVTLLVTPRQASILDLAQNKGTLHLALRNPTDETDAEGSTATLADLGLDRSAPPAPAAKEDRSKMASMVTPGMRALTILTPSFSASLAGLLHPGDRVDVLLTMTPTGAGKDIESTTTTLMQNVELLAAHVNTKVDPPDDLDAVVAPKGKAGDLATCPSVTLLVTPRQASILDLAQSKGTLHLALRNADDVSDEGDSTATVADLLPQQQPSIAPAAEPTPVVLSIRTLRGTLSGRDEITVLKRARPSGRGVSALASPAPPRQAR
ncbi:Flp pilus assembly protein CpaB [Paludisphaera soli]|uniref:Flp pilus assembly protein CpaB n=1 Tax=Paludisphaera soli TaxID=2712865 RepID=UPI001F0FBD9D|nr:Flp pilus assembly protein CpaB [Paludisphaera soli]